MMLYVNPDLTVKQVKNILYSTATDLYKPGYDIYTGHGNVNAYAAVAAAAGVKVKIPSEKLKRPVFRAESAGRDAIELSWKKRFFRRYSFMDKLGTERRGTLLVSDSSLP